MARDLGEYALLLLIQTGGGSVLTIALRERRRFSLKRRRSRIIRSVETLTAGMELVGCTLTFCWPYHELGRRGKLAITPVMESRVDESSLERSGSADPSGYSCPVAVL